MKQTSTLTNITKAIIKLFANLAILQFTILSVSALVLLFGLASGQFHLESLSAVAELPFSPENTFGGINAFILTFVAGNSLITYGLIKLKAFVRHFQAGDLLTDRTITFLKKGSALVAIVSLVQGIAEYAIDPNYLLINLSLAAWLYLASLAISFAKKYRTHKVA